MIYLASAPSSSIRGRVTPLALTLCLRPRVLPQCWCVASAHPRLNNLENLHHQRGRGEGRGGGANNGLSI